MEQNTIPSRGGRPRKISPDVALDRSVDAFWKHGLHGTSLDELSIATGLKRPSLAATFGDKNALYLAALGKRAQLNAEALETALASDLPLPAVLARVYEGALKVGLAGDEGPQGCFLISTAVAPARFDPEVAAVLRTALDRIERAFLDRFRRDGYADADIRAGLAASTLHHIAIRTRAGEAPARLRARAKAAAAWLGQAEPDLNA